MEYRLSEHCGRDAEHEDVAAEITAREDAQVEYRLGEARDLEWIGSGLADVGLGVGAAVGKRDPWSPPNPRPSNRPPPKGWGITGSVGDLVTYQV
ncbi:MULTISPECIES: hypothetical protein [Streptomyces violaceusniger group]|uniref:Uncharacterized protein n=2 Tax=Streptomyces rhizosphaericus TaxID=114699 RepID=A0ABP3ZCI6_9ACTN|nr:MULTISPECIES: hypothetical protein [Streptomyces violaceusniger group]